MARFATFTVGVAGHRAAEGAAVRLARTSPENNYIDALVDAKLKKLRIAPVGAVHRRGVPPPRVPRHHRPAADARGVRPVHGRAPTPNKREQAGRRAARPQGVRRDVGDEVGGAAADPVVATGQLQGDAAVLQLAAGQDRQQRADRTRWCRSCSAASGGTFKNPATNYYQIETDTLKVAENVAQVFMGMRIQCAQCHNHPFDRWTMDDYYGFAAFFTPDRPQGRRGPARDRSSSTAGGGEVHHPVARPADDAEVPRRRRRRTSPARTAARCWPNWLASPENPYFATNLANIVWAHFFGQGIVDAVDDVRVSNPAGEPGAARRAGQEVHRVQVRLQEAGPRHLHVADLPARDAAERDATRATRGTSPAADPPHPGRDAARLHHAGDRDEEQVPRPAARAPGRCRSPTAASAPTSSPRSAGRRARRSARAR